MKFAFKELWKYITKNKFDIVKLIVILFIPLLYGFCYIASFWNPISYSDKLKVGIVVKDSNKTSISLAKEMSGEKEILDHKFNIQYREGENAKIDDLYTYVEIPENFYTDSISYLLVHNEDKKPSITIHGSYKKNYLIAEFSEMASELSKSLSTLLVVKAVETHLKDSQDPKSEINKIITFIRPDGNASDPILYSVLSEIQKQIDSGTPVGTAFVGAENIVHKLVDRSKFFDINIVMEGKDKSTYGYGLSPFFISIAAWIGALMSSFIIKRKRAHESITFGQNWFTKMVFGQIIGIIQMTILITMLIPVGLNLGKNEWQLYLFAYFMSVVFVFIAQSILFLFNHDDVGKFILLVLLIIQLVASGGIFPTTLQPAMFDPVSYALPFKYTILGLRGIIYESKAIEIVTQFGILSAFAIGFVAISVPIQKTLFNKKPY